MNQNQKPSVAILIPVYNAEEFIKDCLDSVINQTYENIEVFCIDDCSKDKSFSILQEYARKYSFIKVSKNTQNLGIGETLNKLLDNTRGYHKYVCRLDADDICFKERIQEQVSFMENNSEVDISGTYVKTFGENVEPSIRTCPAKHDDIIKAMLHYNCFWHPTIIIRNSFIEKHNIRYDSRYKTEDYELWVRCFVEHSATFANLDKVLLHYRIGNHQLTHYNSKYNLSEDTEIACKLVDYNVKNIMNKQSFKAFSEKNNIPIVFGVDNNYIKYLSVTIQSIYENSSDNNSYDLIIFHEGIKNKYKKSIKKQIVNKPNFSVRFIEISKYINVFGKAFFHSSRHISIASYYRIFIPLLLSKYDKCIYLDSDTIVTEDISELFNTQLKNGNLIAGTKELLFEETYKNLPEKLRLYYKNEVKLKHTNSYFNAGVLLLDIKNIIKSNHHIKAFHAVKNISKPHMHDQDILNSVFQNSFQHIGYQWNFMVNLFSYKNYNIEALQNILKDKTFKIIHYADYRKPWNYKKIPLSEYFWKFAKNTIFYKTILLKSYTDIRLTSGEFYLALFQSTNTRKNVSLEIHIGRVFKLTFKIF